MSKLTQRYGRELYGLTKDLEKKEAAEIIRQFIALLKEKHQLNLAPKILEAYESYAKGQEGWLEASVATADELTDAAAKHLTTALEKATGKKVELRRTTDPKLLGGAVIRYGDTLLDASLKRRLESLKTKMTE